MNTHTQFNNGLHDYAGSQQWTKFRLEEIR